MDQSTRRPTIEEEPYDPEDILAALGRLRDAVFLAIDEASREGQLSAERARSFALLGADVWVINKRLIANTKRLLESVDQLNKGQVVTMTLDELRALADRAEKEVFD